MNNLVAAVGQIRKDEIPAILIVITRPRSPISKVIARLKDHLVRRGFRVDSCLVGKTQKVSVGADIVLLSCRNCQVEQLAEQIEKEWTERWNTWYLVSRSKKRNVFNLRRGV